jgi:hypothetical protein
MKCHILCEKFNTECPIRDCKMWIDFENDLNCTYIAIKKNGPLKFKDIGQRLDMSPSRIKQIEIKAKEKIFRSHKLLNVIQ